MPSAGMHYQCIAYSHSHMHVAIMQYAALCLRPSQESAANCKGVHMVELQLGY